MRTRRTKDQIRKDNYNKDVDAYNFYVVNLDTKRAETGFEFKSDAVDLLNDYDDKKKYKVVSKRALKSMGIENPNESFKYEGGGYFDGTIPEVSSYMTTYAKGGGFDKQIAFRVENDYIGWLPLGLYDIKLADDYNSQYSFYKFSDALNKLFDYFNNEDGSYLIKNYPESVFYVRKLYAGNKKNNMGDTEIIDKKVFKISAKEILDYKKTYSLKNGGTLIGNQKSIDLNKNGKIDAEDFKIMRTTMNGGWRKDHKYVNSSNPKEDYEVIYARKFKPSRKGYKGKTNFASGGLLKPHQRYVLEMKGLTGLSEQAIENYISGNKLSDNDVLNIVIGLGRKQLKASEVSRAVVGKKDNISSKKVIAFAKDNKGMKLYSGGGFQSGVYADGGSLAELNKKVMSYDKPIEYKGSMYATIYGANFRDTVAGTKKGDIYWTSTNKELLNQINKEIFNSNGSVMPFSELDPNIFILSVELSNIKSNYEFGGGFQSGVYANGGGVGRFSEYSNDALYDMMINLARYENTESDIQMVKAELEKRKGENSGIQEEMDLFDDKRLRLRKPVMPEKKYSEREWAEKFNPRAYEFMGKRKMATGGEVENYRTLSFKTKSTAEKNQKEIINYYGNRVLNTTIKRGIDERGDNGYYVEFNLKKYKLADGGGISKFKMLSDKVARNYEGKRVKPQYQKEYGKVYSKSEAKEVGDKVAGKVKANQKMATGGETKKGGKGGIMVLAKKIRKEGESWQDALKRAGQQLK